MLRLCGKSGNEKIGSRFGGQAEQFVLECLDRQIEAYEKDKQGYEMQFTKLARSYPEIRHQKSLPGMAKISGGRSYGKRNPRYSRQLKSVYKSGVLAAIGGNNPINDYYNSLIQDGYAQHNARQKACRRLAILSLGVFKSGKRYQPDRRNHVKGGKQGTSSL